MKRMNITNVKSALSSNNQVARPSRLGLLSFISGIVMVTASSSLFYWPLLRDTQGNDYSRMYLFHGTLAVLSLLALVAFSIRSFRKIAYPNILGLVGLLLNLLTFYSAVSTILSLLSIRSAGI